MCGRFAIAFPGTSDSENSRLLLLLLFCFLDDFAELRHRRHGGWTQGVLGQVTPYRRAVEGVLNAAAVDLEEIFGWTNISTQAGTSIGDSTRCGTGWSAPLHSNAGFSFTRLKDDRAIVLISPDNGRAHSSSP